MVKSTFILAIFIWIGPYFLSCKCCLRKRLFSRSNCHREWQNTPDATFGVTYFQYLLHLLKSPSICYIVTSGWTNPESWMAAEKEKTLLISTSPLEQSIRWSCMCVSVCLNTCVDVWVHPGTEMQRRVLLVQCILVEIKIILKLCEWGLRGG